MYTVIVTNKDGTETMQEFMLIHTTHNFIINQIDWENVKEVHCPKLKIKKYNLFHILFY